MSVGRCIFQIYLWNARISRQWLCPKHEFVILVFTLKRKCKWLFVYLFYVTVFHPASLVAWLTFASSTYRRGLNPPHRVKSISMTTFTQQEIEFLQKHSNEVSWTLYREMTLWETLFSQLSVFYSEFASWHFSVLLSQLYWHTSLPFFLSPISCHPLPPSPSLSLTSLYHPHPNLFLTTHSPHSFAPL